MTEERIAIARLNQQKNRQSRAPQLPKRELHTTVNFSLKRKQKDSVSFEKSVIFRGNRKEKMISSSRERKVTRRDSWADISIRAVFKDKSAQEAEEEEEEDKRKENEGKEEENISDLIREFENPQTSGFASIFLFSFKKL